MQRHGSVGWTASRPQSRRSGCPAPLMPEAAWTVALPKRCTRSATHWCGSCIALCWAGSTLRLRMALVPRSLVPAALRLRFVLLLGVSLVSPPSLGCVLVVSNPARSASSAQCSRSSDSPSISSWRRWFVVRHTARLPSNQAFLCFLHTSVKPLILVLYLACFVKTGKHRDGHS